ncbi:hypothetical protein KKB43_01810 [Patescibacteria group bacterium]|nr:hypothetical protein [Patescibacteria group bacterium]MBU4579730.1 hypothetical protein [Patescibacteria group bacterium]
MSENNLVQNNNLPEKSNLWIASNIAAGAILTNMIIKFIGGMIFSQFIFGNFLLNLIYAIIIILIGAYLGSKFGVQYAVKQSIINPDKIDSISKATAIIPFLFLLIVVIQNIYVSSYGVEKFELPVIDLFVTLIFASAVYYFCKKFLLEFVEKRIQVGQLMNNMTIASGKNDNGIKILIGSVILTIIGSSIFFVWKSFEKDVVLINPIVIPSAVVNPSVVISTPIPINEENVADWKTYANSELGYEIKYPNRWFFSENELKNDIHISSFERNSDKILPDEATIEIQTFYKKPENMDLLSFVKSNFDWSETESGLHPWGKLSLISLNGLNAVHIIHSGGDGPDGPGYVIEKNSKEVFYILVYGRIQNQLVNKILFTFKPIENKEMINWKIYDSKTLAQFPSEKYTIKYPSDWSYSERRIEGDRNLGKLETIFMNNKKEEVVRIIAGDILSKYQDKKYLNRGETNIGSLNYQFLRLEETSIGSIIYLFNTGGNMIVDPAKKGYYEVIVFNANFTNNQYLNDMLSTFEFNK